MRDTVLTVVALTVSALVVAPASLLAQAADPFPSPTFEAASVKENRSGERNMSVGRQPGGRFVATNAPLWALITMAYQLQPFQLQGGDAWLVADRWDIVGRVAGDPPPAPPGEPDPMWLALRTLLADRFGLRVRRQTQDLPVYALVLHRSDGKLGPGLRRAAVDCAAVAAETAAGAREGRPAPAPANTPDKVSCGMRTNPGVLLFGGYPLSLFANGLANNVQRMVVDRTGLTGNWDFELTFSPEGLRYAPPAPGQEPPTVDANRPSLFTAVQEQLGLRLESTTAPVEVVVIDSVEKPKPD